jgi:ubiquinone/menaquinone biosynthesis C-methylase UbiE
MSQRWPDEPHYPRDLFAGTAAYYARYRPPYPAGFVRELLEAANLDRRELAVDLACGTGQVAFALAPHFRRVHAVDQEPEMVATGRELALAEGLVRITWEVAAVETVQLAPDSVDLVSIGNAFHRVPRLRLAQAAYQWLRAGGVFVDLSGTTMLAGPEPWQRLVAQTIERWTPAQTRPVGGHGARTSAEVLADAGFAIVRRHTQDLRRTWTLDEIVGYVYSTSVASKRALGPTAGEFETDLRTTLLAHNASGTFEETMQFYFVLGRKIV